MENTGITPVMPIGNGYGDGFGNSSFVWIFALLALMWGGNGGFFGNNNLGYRPATAEDVNNGFNFNDLQNQNRDIMNAINAGAAQSVAATNQAKYDNINVAKDIQMALSSQIADVRTMEQAIGDKVQTCCCETNRNIDSVNYNAAMNTAAINANTTAQTQKILDALAQNRIDALQNKVNQLELQNAVAGVVKYPQTTTFSAGYNPFYGPACGCNNFNGNI